MLKRALWVDPISPSARYTDAVFTLEESGVTASEQKTLQALELDPNFVPALQRYGVFRWRFDGKLVEAIQFIEHAIALDPNNSRLRQNAEALYLDLGDVTAARDVAAGTFPNVRTAGLLSMHEGDWRGAGLAAYDESGWTKDDDLCQNWLASEAIRDYAMKTGDLSRAIAFIKLKYYLDDAPAVHLDPCSFRAAVYLSQLMGAAGQGVQALALRRAASLWLDANATKYFTGAGRLRALVLLLDGKQDAALSRTGGFIPIRVLRRLVVHHELRSPVVAAPWRSAIPGYRRRRAALCRCAAQPARGAAPTWRCAEARRTGRCALNRGSNVIERYHNSAAALPGWG